MPGSFIFARGCVWPPCGAGFPEAERAVWPPSPFSPYEAQCLTFLLFMEAGTNFSETREPARALQGFERYPAKRIERQAVDFAEASISMFKWRGNDLQLVCPGPASSHCDTHIEHCGLDWRVWVRFAAHTASRAPALLPPWAMFCWATVGSRAR